MPHKFLVLAGTKWLKSLYIYQSYRKIKTGVSLFLDHPVGYIIIILILAINEFLKAHLCWPHTVILHMVMSYDIQRTTLNKKTGYTNITKTGENRRDEYMAWADRALPLTPRKLNSQRCDAPYVRVP